MARAVIAQGPIVSRPKPTEQVNDCQNIRDRRGVLEHDSHYTRINETQQLDLHFDFVCPGVSKVKATVGEVVQLRTTEPLRHESELCLRAK